MRALVLGFCLLLPATAFAADQLPPPLHAPPPVVYNWTGIYIGSHGGYGWGRTQGPISLYGIESVDQSLAGGLAGAQIGANHQIHRVVLGVELSGSWSNLTGSSACIGLNPSTVATTSTCEIKQEWSAQLVTRFGYAPGDGRLLPYILGGIVIARLDPSLETIAGMPPPDSFFTSFGASWGAARQHQGALVGVGLQYAWGPGLSVGFELLHAIYDMQDQGSRTSTTTIVNNGGEPNSFTNERFIPTALNLTTNSVRVVMNYRFD
jgi:outer membrane immunogenic protein